MKVAVENVSKIPTESAIYEDISHILYTNMWVCRHTSCGCLWRLKGMTVSLSLSSEQNKSCHLLMVACGKTKNKKKTKFTKSFWIFSVPSPSFSHTKMWKGEEDTADRIPSAENLSSKALSLKPGPPLQTPITKGSSFETRIPFAKKYYPRFILWNQEPLCK